MQPRLPGRFAPGRGGPRSTPSGQSATASVGVFASPVSTVHVPNAPTAARRSHLRTHRRTDWAFRSREVPSPSPSPSPRNRHVPPSARPVPRYITTSVQTALNLTRKKLEQLRRMRFWSTKWYQQACDKGAPQAPFKLRVAPKALSPTESAHGKSFTLLATTGNCPISIGSFVRPQATGVSHPEPISLSENREERRIARRSPRTVRAHAALRSLGLSGGHKTSLGDRRQSAVVWPSAARPCFTKSRAHARAFGLGMPLGSGRAGAERLALGAVARRVEDSHYWSSKA